MPLHCTISRKEIIESLNSLQNITNKKSTTMAILGNVLIETAQNGLILTGTDLEIGMRIHVPAQVSGEGMLTLPSKKLFEIVRESGTAIITLEEKDNNWVTISAGLSTYNLAGMGSDEFPEFPEFEDTSFTSFPSHVFLELIDKIIYSIANEQENIYSLNSVLFEKEIREKISYLKMISSDGHRLSIMEKEVSENLDGLHLNPVTLIPKKGIQEWKKFCEGKDRIDVSFENKQLVLRDATSVMVIRLKSGEFPNYSAIIESIKLDNCIEINRIPFLDSLKRINLFTEDNFHTIQINIQNDVMVLSSQSAELGNAKDEQVISYSGEPLVLGFNCRYFIETLQIMECEKLEAYINGNNNPCLLKSKDDKGFLSIIMPMQL